MIGDGSLVVAFGIGIAFGWTLERAGLGSARKLVGQFYLTDLTVLKVMFSAIVTAMLGVFWLSRLGLLDLSRVYVPETFLLPQLAGGLIFGAGFALAGLCPGTSCVAAASGRGDGAVVVAGMFTGVLLTGLFFSPLQAFYERDARGTLTWPQVLHVPYGTVVFLVALMAIAAFVVAERVEGVRRGEAPREMMAHYRRALAVAALALGGLAALVRSPVPTGSSVDIAALARAVEREDDHVTAVELATWIKDRKPGLRVIDVRSAAEFDTFHVPTAERVALEALVTAPFTDRETIVLYSDGGTHAAQGWVFLRARGLSHVYFLRGGLADWLDDVMNPTLAHDATPEARAAFERVVPLSRYFGGAPRRETATDPAAQATTPRSSVADAVARMRRRGC